MDTKLLEYYNRELRYLRELGGEFAREFPKIAGRLGLDAVECADPYVERLLEGFAFLAARVQLKIDDEFPRFTENMLEMLCPHYLGPTPSMAVVCMTPDPQQGAFNEGFSVPRGTSLRSKVGPRDATACEYRTAHDVVLWPVELTSVAHGGHVADLGDLPAARRPIKGTVRLRLRTTNGLPFSDLAMDELALFVRGDDACAARLFELLAANAVGIVVRSGAGGTNVCTKGGAVRPLGFDDEEALLPVGPRAFQGYRLLHEYFALPSRFLFVELTGLGAGVRRCPAEELEIVVLLDRVDALVETGISADHVSLFCTPAINLFPKKTDRIQLNDKDQEHHVVPDRTRPMDIEIHSITRVTAFGSGGDRRREFLPFYGNHLGDAGTGDPSYYTVHRRPRITSLGQRAHGRRSSYLGGEVFLSLVDGGEGPHGADLRQLGVDALCTNRDLPLQMDVGGGRTDFFLESSAPVAAVRCVAGPSPPRMSPARGEANWRLISHLKLNYLTLSNAGDGHGATALRELLGLYADLSEPATRRQIDGIRSIANRPVLRRLPLDGPPSFARGAEIVLECDEAAFEGTSVVVLGLVLERFFAKFVSINSFAETALRSTQRGELLRWPPRLGRRPTI